MKIDTIYIDMDGTIANFAKSAYNLVGFDGSEFKNLTNLTSKQKEQQQILFKAIDDNPLFFKYEEPYEFAGALYFLSKSISDNVFILSNYRPPKDKPEILSRVQKYKIDWIYQNIDSTISKHNIIITDKPKYEFSGVNKLLIDDMPQNIEKWEKNGGKGIIFNDWKSTQKQLLKLKLQGR